MSEGIWTMTEAEFRFSMARAWDEGAEAASEHWAETAHSPNNYGPVDPPRNPYEPTA